MVPAPVVPESLKLSLISGECAVFVGAGASVAAGLPNWKELLQRLMGLLQSPGVDESVTDELHQMLDAGQLLDVAECLKQALRPRALSDALVRELGAKDLKPTVIHQRLAELAFNCYVTTNYDDLLEDAISEVRGRRGCTFVTYDNTAALARCLTSKDPFLIKAHGKVDDVERLIFGR